MRFISVVLNQSCSSVMKRGNLLLRTRQGCMGHRMIRMMYGVRLFDRVSTDVPHYRVGVVVKVDIMIIQSRLW